MRSIVDRQTPVKTLPSLAVGKNLIRSSGSETGEEISLGVYIARDN